MLVLSAGSKPWQPQRYLEQKNVKPRQQRPPTIGPPFIGSIGPYHDPFSISYPSSAAATDLDPMSSSTQAVYWPYSYPLLPSGNFARPSSQYRGNGGTTRGVRQHPLVNLIPVHPIYYPTKPSLAKDLRNSVGQGLSMDPPLLVGHRGDTRARRPTLDDSYFDDEPPDTAATSSSGVRTTSVPVVPFNQFPYK